MDIWSRCKDAVVPGPLAGELVRLVESQEQVATNALVDSLAEQALLEELLEASKPRLPPEAAGLHYLLASPFRYPPLRHGSRFGARHEPGLFYGSSRRRTALAETAYYRLVFWSGMVRPPPSGQLTTEHTAFGAGFRVARGLRLFEPPFAAYTDALTAPDDHGATQQLGQRMRAAGIEAFAYLSARDPERGSNIALYGARAFTRPRPAWQEAWLCETRADRVAFYGKAQGTVDFPLALFLVGGVLPAPSVQSA